MYMNRPRSQKPRAQNENSYEKSNAKKFAPKPTFCTRACNKIASVLLQLFNIIDLLIGGALLSFGVYLRIILKENYEPDSELEWLGLISFLLGMMFLLVSIFSFSGIISSYCRKVIIPSGYLALILSVFSLIIAIFAVIFELDILDYINMKGQV